jgi:hypothetical protein
MTKKDSCGDPFPCCLSCRWWFPESSERETTKRAQCRRYPPSWSPVGMNVRLWPETEQDDFCGEWRS